MKKKIDASAFASLSAELQGKYKLVGTEYILQLEHDDSDPTPELRRALERERQTNASLTTQLTTLNTELATVKTTLDGISNKERRAAGDIDAIENSWKAKEKTAKEQHAAELDRKNKQLEKLLVRSVAEQIATEIGKSPQVILPHILSRLSADLTSDEPMTRVLGVDGRPSAMSIAELKQEFLDNKIFSDIVVVTKGSGGGAHGKGRDTSSGGGASFAGKKFADMTEVERTDLYKANPEDFKRQRDEHIASTRKF